MNAQLQSVTIDRTDMTVEAAAPSTALTPMQMAYQLAARGADAASIREMLDVGREIERDAARREFDAAFSAAKAEIPPITKAVVRNAARTICAKRYGNDGLKMIFSQSTG